VSIGRFSRWMKELDLDVNAEDLATCEGYVTIDAVRKANLAKATAHTSAATGVFRAIAGLLAPAGVESGRITTALDALASILQAVRAPAVPAITLPAKAAASPTTASSPTADHENACRKAA